MENGVYSPADMAAVMNGGGCNGNNQWNNPMWLIWAILFGRNGGLFGNGENVELHGRLNALSQQIADNQSTNTLNAGIQSTHEYQHGMQNSINMGFAGTNANINNASMANLMSQKDAQAQMASCCCDIKTNILNQTNQLQSAINDARNATVNGFANIGYIIAQQTNDLQNTSNANTQRILDKMCNDTTQNLRDKLWEASQQAQTASIVSQLKTTA